MPAQIVVVHDDAPFQVAVVLALKAEGYSVMAYEDALAAMTALEAANRIELLITRFRFADGRSNGRALALMAKSRKPGLKVIFTAPLAMKEYADEIGRLVAMPVSIPDLVEVVREELS